jgi:BirA family biotin operon repressor/biotin-[acetyl-CoA-carboxylase] ligase
VAGFLARQERFAVVGSTNDVVRGWLADGTPEVCMAVADEQAEGRGRDGRRWVAPPGAALLLSLGFRPTWLLPDRAWRLAAMASLAMAEAAEHVAGLPGGTIRLKWPNDLVIEAPLPGGAGAPFAPLVPQAPAGVRKVAGVLGETDGLGTDDPRAVIGLGINTDWAAADFPPELADSMTSLSEASGRGIEGAALLAAFLERLEVRIEALRDGRFDAEGWTGRQVTSGRAVDLVAPDTGVETVRAIGVDPVSGALLVADDASPAGARAVLVGEIRHVRLAPIVAAGV